MGQRAVREKRVSRATTNNPKVMANPTLVATSGWRAETMAPVRVEERGSGLGASHRVTPSRHTACMVPVTLQPRRAPQRDGLVEVDPGPPAPGNTGAARGGVRA